MQSVLKASAFIIPLAYIFLGFSAAQTGSKLSELLIILQI